MADGHLGKCKDCAKKDIAKNYSVNVMNKDWIDKERTRGREKYHRLYVGTGKSNSESSRKYKQKFPEKKKATIRSNNLRAPSPGLEKHHWSYNDEHFKDVIWLTKKHHMKAHRFLVYDSERKMYRRFDSNELLETKNRHKEFIFMCIKTKPD